MSSRQQQQQANPSGVALTVEYLSYALNSILYLRGVYPASSFKAVQHAETGLTLQVNSDEGVTGYLGAVLSQVAMWLAQDKIKAMSIVIFPDSAPPANSNTANESSNLNPSGDIIERWTFQFRRNTNDVDISVSSHAGQTGPVNLCNSLRHLTASAGMLPPRKGTSTFEVITYNTPDVSGAAAPKSWETSDPMELEGADELPLRPFNAGSLFVDGFITFYG